MIITTDIAGEINQQWLLSLYGVNYYGAEDFFTHSGDVPDIHKLKRSVELVRDLTVWSIRTIPVWRNTSKGLSRADHRGHSEDPKPWVIHGKQIPEITVRIFEDRDKVSYDPYDHSNYKLTKWQLTWLHETFDGALLAMPWQRLLTKLKEDTYKSLLKVAKQDVARFRKQLTVLNNLKVKDIIQ